MTRRRELGAEEGGGRLAGAYVRSGGIWRVRRCHPRLIPVNTPLAASVSSCPPPRRPPRTWTAQTTPRHRPLPLNVRVRLVPAPRPDTHPVVLFIDPPPRQPSISPRPQCRTRSTSSPRPSRLPGSRTPLAMLAGPSTAFSGTPICRRTRYFDRARKVKCNQLPGQDKVRFSSRYHSHPSVPLIPISRPVSGNASLPLRPSAAPDTL